MLIGIISDTHDHISNVKKAVQIFVERGVERVLHAGDIGSPSVVKHFKGLDFALVYGNNDGERIMLQKKVEQIGGKMAGEVLNWECEEGKIVVYHGTVPTFLNAMIRCGDYRLVVSGHTHKVVNQLKGNTRVLNPGTAHDGFEESPTMMIYDTALDVAEVIEL
jgi:uncharacterized protein